MTPPTDRTAARPQIARYDIGIMIAGAAVVIMSFLPWFSANDGFIALSANGWQSKPIAVIAILLCIGVALVVLAQSFSDFRLPGVMKVGAKLLLLLVSVLAVVLIVIRMATFPTQAGVVSGPGAGLYLGLVAAIAEAVFAFMAFKVSGEHAPSIST